MVSAERTGGRRSDVAIAREQQMEFGDLYAGQTINHHRSKRQNMRTWRRLSVFFILIFIFVAMFMVSYFQERHAYRIC